MADVELKDLKMERAHSLYAQRQPQSEEAREALGDDTWFEWDYVLVFKVGSRKQQEEFRHATARAVNRIRKSGLKTYLYKSVQEDEIYCLIGATEKRLRWEADRVDYDLPLDKDRVIEVGLEHGLRLAKSVTSQDEIDRLSKKDEWRQMYGKFESYNPDAPWRSTLYKRQDLEDPRHKDTLFRSIDRIRLIFGILQEDPLLGGAGLKIYNMIRDDQSSLVAAFPLHDNVERSRLEKRWAHSWWPLFTVPSNDIRNYFGEKVAFYFAWLEFYCKWLVPLGIFGIIVWIWQISVWPHPRVDVEILPFVGAVVAVWATLFLEFWKRREATLRADWGMTNFKLKEQPRPEFDGERVRSPVDGSLIKYFPWHRRIMRFFFSQTAIWGLIAIVLGLVTSIFFLRRVLREWNEEVGMILTSLINAIQIQVLNIIYGLVADKLNNWENHRTQSEWENALIAKTFIFKFINSFNSLFYIAFFKRWDLGCGQPSDHIRCFDPTGAMCEPEQSTDCFCYPAELDPDPNPNPDPDCLLELSIQLAIIFGSAIVVNNFVEIISPIIKNYLRLRQNAATEEAQPGKKKEESRPEKEFVLEPYTTLADYDEMVVQFGYVTLFVVAFPLAPLMALVNNYLEIRLDAKKVTAVCQRPNPLGAASIGTWLDILTIVSFIAVLVNTLIVMFFTDIIEEWAGDSLFYKAAVFVITERLIMLVKFAISYLVPDVPRDVQEHVAREAYIVDVLINGKEEETEEVRRRRNTLLGEYEYFSYDAIPDNFPVEHFASDPEYCGKMVHTEQQLLGKAKESKFARAAQASPSPPMSPSGVAGDEMA